MGNVFFPGATNPVEELARIFRDAADPVAAATQWAQGVFASAELDPKAHPVRAIKALRDAEPALNLNAATYVVKKITGDE